MSLNDISLPSQLVTDLYRCALVDNIQPAAMQNPPVPFLGKAAKNILIVVEKPDVPYLSDEELAFLVKVLQACSLGLTDVAIVNWSNIPHHDADAIMSQFKAKTVVLFDTEPGYFHLPAGSPLYAVIDSKNRKFVLAPPLNEIEKTKEAKSQLWLALKQVFCI